MSRHTLLGGASNAVPRFLALGCVGLIATATPAFAQTQGGAQDSVPPRSLGSSTVTATALDDDVYKVDKADSPKFTAPLIDTPRTVTVIPSQLLHDTASASLTDALRTVPGITLGAGEGGNPLGDRPFIRGFDSQASTYLDGVRDVGAQSRELFAVEQIEVVKGSDSSMGGRGSAGGSLNLVSKVPTADKFIAASASLGTDDYKRVTVDINQPITDNIGVRLAGMWHDQDMAGRDAVWSKRWGIAPSIKIGLEGPTSLTLSYYHMESDELPDSGIPYLYNGANAALAKVSETQPARDYTTIGGVKIHRPRDAYYGLKDRDFRENNVNNVTARIEHQFAGGVTLRNTTRYGRSTQGYVWTQPDDQQGNVYGTNAANAATAGGLVWRRTNTRYSYSEGLINQTDLFGEKTLFGMKHSFAASLEFARERAANGTYVSNAATGAAIATASTQSPRCSIAMINRYNCTTVTNPNPNDPWLSYASDTSNVLAGIERSLSKTWTRTKVDTVGISLFDTITLTDQLLLNIGGRYDRYETKVSPGLTATSTADRTWVKRTDDLWNYQVGLVFKPTENTSLYISTSSAATPPGSYLAQGSEGNALTTAGSGGLTAQELTDALKIEKTKSYEIGAKADLFDGGLALTAAIFQTKTKNARATSENGTVAFIGERKIKGFELGFNGNITPQWNVFGGYTYMDAKIVDGGFTVTSGVAAPSVNTGKRFPNTPKHSFTLFTNYQPTDKIQIGGGAIYMGKVYGGYSDIRSVVNGKVVISSELARSVPSYWRFDANASYKFSDAIQLQLNVQNVFNKLYYDKAYAAHYASQAAGRTAIVTLNVKY